jgi:NDP-sugar pyrophosphorylase family protein
LRAIILAGGKGTRLAPYTTIFPKPLMPVGEMPILEVVISQLKYFGIEEITLAIGHLGELIIAYFGDGSKHGVRIEYSREEQPLGTAGPLSLIGPLDDTFLVMNGDLLTTMDFRSLLTRHKQSGAIATIAAYEYQTRIDLGILEIDGDHKVIGYLEKPTYTNRVSMGIYAFEPEVLEFVTKGVQLDLPDLILRMVKASADVRASVFDGFWLDIGRPADYAYVTERSDELLPILLHQVSSARPALATESGLTGY